MPVTPEQEFPLILDDVEALARFGTGADEGAGYREQLLAWVEEAEDTCGAIETSFDVALAQSEEDLPLLDELLEAWRAAPPPEEEIARIALAWGGYLGELVQQNLGGSWVLRSNSVHHSVHFPRLALQWFPVHAVLRAMTLGDSLEIGYERLVEALSA